MSVNKFKVGDVVKCVDSGIFNNLTTGKDYVSLDVNFNGEIKVENDKGNCFYYYSYRFELSNGGSANAQQPPKFKVGDVVKCVDAGAYNNLTTGKEYVLVEVSNDSIVKFEDDVGDVAHYYSYRFELSNNDETPQPPKFKEGDMVYLIGFGYFKPCKLLLAGSKLSRLKFKIVMSDGNWVTLTANGCYTPKDVEPSLVIATEENRQMLNKLLGVEYESLKLTGSDLAKKLLKDKPQTCYVSDNSDEHATSSGGGVVLIMEYENDRFISKSGVGWKFAVPCDKHGEVLEDE